MKLYYSSGTCSTSCHIALEEAGLTYTGVEVSFDKNQNVTELEKLNPLGVVPVFISEEGETLTQNTAILEYIADLKPNCHLLGEKGSWDRAVTMSWVSFVAADFHKAFSMLFRAEQISETKSAQDDIKTFSKTQIQKYLSYIDVNLEGKEYITGQKFTIADAYLFTVLGWCKWADIKTDSYKNVSSYMTRVYKRPAVQKVLKIEDLLD